MAKKVLFSFVGEQDPVSPKTQEEGSIVTLYRHIRPDYVYLFPTAKAIGRMSDTEDNARETEEWIKQIVDPDASIFIRPVSFNPVSYQEILDGMYREIPLVLNEFKPQDEDFEIHLNCSSGTPQLKSTWLILTYGRYIPNPHLWQVNNPVFVSPEKRVEEIKVDFIEENATIDRMVKYARTGLFGVVASEALRLKEISINSSQKYRARLVFDIFSAYEKWDLLKYREAYERLSRVCREYRGSRDLKEALEILERQKGYLHHLQSGQERETMYNIVDIYFNARRRLQRLDYTETLARFWRVYEGILYAYLRECYRIEPSNLSQSADKNKARGLMGFLNMNNPNLPMGIYNAERALLQHFEDRAFKRVMEEAVEVDRGVSKERKRMKEVLTELREKRNHSIVAHGMQPVERMDAENAIMLCEKLLERIVLAREGFTLTQYPFKEEEYMAVLKDVLNLS